MLHIRPFPDKFPPKWKEMTLYQRIYYDFKREKICGWSILMRRYKLTYEEAIEIVKKLSKQAYRVEKVDNVIVTVYYKGFTKDEK